MFIDTTSDVATRVTGAIREAARVTGAGFDYLLKTALRESNFDPNLKASTSSATGLFQFIDQTWLGTLKTAGPSLGYGHYAEAIEKTSAGRYVVTDPATSREIMSLRTDPAASAIMAGAFTTRNAADLAEAIGRKPSDGELYMAHFLGAAGAARFIAATAKAPNAPAAASFPEAARANRSIFYNRWGTARSFAQVYDRLVRPHEVAAPAPIPAAGAGTIAPATGAAAQQARVAPLIQDAQAATTPPAQANVAARSGLPVFHDLFRSESRAGVAAGVAALWGQRPAAPVQLASAVAPASPAAPGRIGAPLDLFQFLRPEIQGIAKRSL